MDKDGKDVNGRVMHGVVKAMTDRQMKAVAEYAADCADRNEPVSRRAARMSGPPVAFPNPGRGKGAVERATIAACRSTL